MTHPLLSETLAGLSFGLPQSAANLTMFSLCHSNGRTPDYLTLAGALQRDLAEITEVSEQGSVPNLRFLNKADLAILLLDGEELAGAKQNRVLNLTILVPARTTLTIPVSCVERGRWSYRRRHFEATGAALHARARAEKAAAVSESLAAGRRAVADQGALWGEIDRKAAAMCVRSETDAMSDIYESRASALAELRGRLQPVPDQVGDAFAINGRVAGVELFDSPATCGKNLAKLIDSYSMDAIEVQPTAVPKAAVTAVKEFLNDLQQTPVERYAALGIGEDLRLRGKRVQGAALLAQERLVHLSAYRMEVASGADFQAAG